MSNPQNGNQGAGDAASIRASILELVQKYYEVAHQRKPFDPGKTRVQYSGRVYDQQ